MRVLLYEHVSSGGFAGEPIPPSLLSEGFGMLRGLASDFCAAGHTVTVLLDDRIAMLSAPIAADHIVQVSPSGEADQTMEKASETSDSVLIIAPESNGILKQMVECIETASAHSLNSRPNAIEEASNKNLLSQKLRALGLNYPKTITLSLGSNDEIKQTILNNFNLPVVVKPIGGAGCAGTSLVSNENEIPEALDKVAKESSSTVIAQELIQGVPASVSLISNGNEALPISVNLQDITLASPKAVCTYNGGVVPFEHPLASEACDIARKVVESFGGLRGYVGVDLILTDEKVVVMEINPRLTTSYIGVRRVSDFNVAEAISNAVLKGDLPENPQTAGVSFFTKVPVSRPIIFAWQEMCAMEELISPPFPLANVDISYGMLQSYGDSAGEALQKMHDAKNRLQEIWLRGQHPW